MNFIDYAIGLGAGVLITLIISSIKKSKEEKASEEEARQQNISQRFGHIENSINDNYFHLLKRLEKLESRKR